MAERIRLSRAKGWRKPEGTIVVSRPSRWGNPFTLDWARLADPDMPDGAAREWVVACYLAWLTDDAWAARLGILQRPRAWVLEHISELTGKNLACWCYLDRPCHADVLIELANTPGGAS